MGVGVSGYEDSGYEMIGVASGAGYEEIGYGRDGGWALDTRVQDMGIKIRKRFHLIWS